VPKRSEERVMEHLLSYSGDSSLEIHQDFALRSE
jgi:hypothetical protein